MSGARKEHQIVPNIAKMQVRVNARRRRVRRTTWLTHRSETVVVATFAVEFLHDHRDLKSPCLRWSTTAGRIQLATTEFLHSPPKMNGRLGIYSSGVYFNITIRFTLTFFPAVSR
jgi:hypothetical protein